MVEVDPREVRSFYDSFMRSRMLSYRLYGSRRIEAALATVLQYVKPSTHAVDIGCGIGIIAERIACEAPRGRHWACDLSDENLWYARMTAARKNLTYVQCDVGNEFPAFRRDLPATVDLVTMIDVIEHIAPANRSRLLTDLSGILAEGGKLIVTYPTPDYQRYLIANKPEELQPVDEITEADALVREATAAGLILHGFKTVDMEFAGQYVHCIFTRPQPIRLVEPDPAQKMADVVSGFWRWRIRSFFRKRRYVYSVFGRDGSRK